MTILSGKFLRFAMTGGLVFCIDFLALWGLQRILPSLVAVSLAYITAVTIHFLLSRNWVFENQHSTGSRQLLSYAFCVGLCWLCTIACFSMSLNIITSNIYIAKALAIPPTTLLGFALMRRLVFHPVNPTQHPAAGA